MKQSHCAVEVLTLLVCCAYSIHQGQINICIFNHGIMEQRCQKKIIYFLPNVVLQLFASLFRILSCEFKSRSEILLS